jgi:uncharacterized protein (TIGR04255 family)
LTKKSHDAPARAGALRPAATPRRGKQLPNKPLVEALLELRWALRDTGSGLVQDPAYPLFIGRFYERVSRRYTFVEELPTAQIPEQMTAYLATHRFRSGKDRWPLVQVGPGVATLNFTADYDWPTFYEAAQDLFPKLLASYVVEGQVEVPRFANILLRYINAVDVDLRRDDVTRFLSENLHTDVSLPSGIVKSGYLRGAPLGINMTVSYALYKPQSTATIRIGSGLLADQPSIVWELSVQSTDEVPQTAEAFETWLSNAHDVIEEWFFVLIEGPLEHQFMETK